MESIYNPNLAQSGHKSVADPESEEMEAPGVRELAPNMLRLKLGQLIWLFKGKLLTLYWNWLKKLFFLNSSVFPDNCYLKSHNSPLVIK